MNRHLHVPALAAGPLLVCAFALPATGAPNPVLATVNGDPVPLSRVLGATDTRPAPGEARKILDRMIGVELVIQEGYRMGLEETLEVRDQLGIFERDTLRDGLFAERVASLKADPKQVESMAKAMAVEVRIRSAAFAARADAEKLATRAAKGDDFDAAARELAANGKGNVDPGEGFIRLSELLPGVQAAVGPLSPGRVSAVYTIGDRFVVSKLVERRDAPDPDARAKAEAEALSRLQLETIAKFTKELEAKYAKVDEKLFASLDFDAEKPGFESFLKDGRTLVTIAGDQPITVGDLADAVRKRLFHGADRAAERGRLNRKKNEVLDDLIAKRVVLKEARAKGLDEKPEYLALRDRVERELVFGAFVAKVIEPEVKVGDAEIEAYYKSHRKDFTGPDMARLESVAFSTPKDAEAALGKLRAGADLAWVRSNAPGRIDPKSRQDLLVFPGAPVTLRDLPEDLRRALEKSGSGEYRLYAGEGGATYVILVKEFLPGTTLPLEDAEGRIRGRLTGEKRQKVFDEYAAKLREASDVKILVSPEELEKLVAAAPPR